MWLCLGVSVSGEPPGCGCASASLWRSGLPTASQARVRGRRVRQRLSAGSRSALVGWVAVDAEGGDGMLSGVVEATLGMHSDIAFAPVDYPEPPGAMQLSSRWHAIGWAACSPTPPVVSRACLALTTADLVLTTF